LIVTRFAVDGVRRRHTVRAIRKRGGVAECEHPRDGPLGEAAWRSEHTRECGEVERRFGHPACAELLDGASDEEFGQPVRRVESLPHERERDGAAATFPVGSTAYATSVSSLAGFRNESIAMLKPRSAAPAAKTKIVPAAETVAVSAP
jgi:hypothetical protein